MRTFAFLLLGLLFYGADATGLSSGGGDESDVVDSKEKQQQAPAAGDKSSEKKNNEDSTINRLMEMLTEVRVEFDPDTITPEEVKQLVKEHKVIYRYANLKRKSTPPSGNAGKKENKTSAAKPNRKKPIKGHVKRGNKHGNRKKMLPKRRPLLKTGRVDYSYIEDPVRRGLLERIKKRGIIPHAEEMSIEQLQRLHETLNSNSGGEL